MSDYDVDVFLGGQEVDLIVLTAEIVDKTNWYSWFNNEKNMANMQKHYYPNTRTMQHNYLRSEIDGNPDKIQLGIYYKIEKEMIGTISLNNIDFLNRKCEIAGFIGEERFQNMRFFVEANKLIIKHAFSGLNLNRIYGASLSETVTKMYIRLLDFKAEGILVQDVFKNGEYRDLYSIALLKSDCTYLEAAC